MKDKKSGTGIPLKFLGILAALYGVGYLVGWGIARMQDAESFEEVVFALRELLMEALPPAFMLVCVCAIGIPLVQFLSCRKLYRTIGQHGEEDEALLLLEKRLNGPMISTNVFFIVGMFLLCSLFYMTEITDYGKEGGYQKEILAADYLFYAVSLVVQLWVQKRTIDIEKELNPEKKGNILDPRFRKVWLDSCDEAQKLMTYQACHRAFIVTNYACVILCVITFAVMLLFQTGVYPLACVCVIWLVNTVSYMRTAVKLETGNRSGEG